MKKDNFSISLPWIFWGIASLFYAYQYIIRVLPSILMDPIATKFSINAQDFGQFSGLYYLGYAACHLPLGILLDRWGSKKVMTLCLLSIIAGTLPLIWSNTWWIVLWGRALVGAGSSAAILSAFQLINQNFDKRHFSRMLGGCVTIGLLGAIYGGQPLQKLITHQGWETALKTVLFFGILLTVFILLFIPSSKLEKYSGNIWEELKDTMKNPYVLKICLFAGCMVGPMEGFADVWAKVYLEKIYGFDSEQAAFLPSLIFLGMCIGAPLLGILAEKTWGYYSILALSGLIMGVIFFMILLGWGQVFSISIGFFIIGILSAYQILAIFKATTYVRPELIGMTTAMANMIIMIFGYFFHSSISMIVHYFWDGTIVQNGTDGMVTKVPLYAKQAYQAGLAIIPLCLLVGGLGFLWLSSQEKKLQRPIHL